ncbi:MAG: FHA domain-containing protein [Acidimicrobiia bacterium]|nr:FHA domain-containing protein [Acidimicrobiia bacterium]
MVSGCPTCGYENPLAARFCSSCGTPLKVNDGPEKTIAYDPSVDPDAAEVEVGTFELPEGTLGMFVVRQGPKRGSRIALDTDEVSIGRHPESDIFLDDVTVSRRHAVVRRVGSEFHVSDAGSLNGTYVNQNLVETARLVDGDEVQIGKFKLVYLALGDRG